MKFDYLITFRSITYAQQGERILKKHGIDCNLNRAPRALTGRGCGYCLRLRGRDTLAAAEYLRSADVPFAKVYAQGDGGGMEERMV